MLSKRVLSPNSRRREARRRRIKGPSLAILTDVAIPDNTIWLAESSSDAPPAQAIESAPTFPAPLPQLPLTSSNSSSSSSATLDIENAPPASAKDSSSSGVLSLLPLSNAERRRKFRKAWASGAISAPAAVSGVSKELETFRERFAFSTLKTLTLHAAAPGTEQQRDRFKDAREALRLLDFMERNDPKAFSSFATPSVALPAQTQVRLAVLH